MGEVERLAELLSARNGIINGLLDERDRERALTDQLAEALIHCAPVKFAARDAALAAWEEARLGWRQET